MGKQRDDLFNFLKRNEFKEGIKEFERRLQNAEDSRQRIDINLQLIRLKILDGDYHDSIDELKQLKQKNEHLFYNNDRIDSFHDFLLGSAYYYLGNINLTQRHAKSAIDLYELVQNPNRNDLAAHCNALLLAGKASWKERKLFTAMLYFMRAIFLIEQCPYSELKFMIGKAANLMGTILIDLKEYNSAKKYLNLALKVYQKDKVLTTDHLYYGILYTDLADYYLKSNKKHQNITKAEKYTNLAHSCFQAIYEERDHRYLATIERLRARIAKEKKSGLKDIIDILSKEVKIRQKAFRGIKHPNTARAYNYMAKAYLRDLDYKYNPESVKQGLIKIELALDEVSHSKNDTKNLKTELNEDVDSGADGNISQKLQALYNKTLLLLHQYRAKKEYTALRHAFETVREAIKVILYSIKYLRRKEERYLLIKQTRPIHEIAMEVFYYVYLRNKNAPGKIDLTLDEVSSWILHNKSSLLLQDLIDKEEVPSDQRKNVQGFATNYSEFIETVNQFFSSIDTLTENKADFEELIEKITKSLKGQPIFDYDFQKAPQYDNDITLAAIQDGISDDNAAIISYFIGKYNIYAICLRRKHVDICQIASTIKECRSLEAKVDKFHKLFNERLKGTFITRVEANSANFDSLLNEYKQESYELYKIFVQKVIESSQHSFSIERLCIIPDGKLWNIPFCALTTSTFGNDFHELDYLIHEYLVSYHFSLPLLYFLYVIDAQQKRPKPLQNFAFYTTHTKSSNYWNTLKDYSHTLKKTGVKAEVITNSHQINPRELFLNFLKERKDDLDGLMLYSHGNFEEESKITSIRFAHEQLTAEDIYNLPLMKLQFIILFSCSAGRGEAKEGLGPSAFSRAFLSKKVKNIILPIVNISINETEELFDSFFTLLYTQGRKTTYAKALHEVKKEFSQKPGWTPFDWAGIVFVGDPTRNMESTKNNDGSI